MHGMSGVRRGKRGRKSVPFYPAGGRAARSGRAQGVGLSEVICDIVETGSTLRENGLSVLEEVCPLSARMVVNQVSMKMENERITKLISDLKTVI